MRYFVANNVLFSYTHIIIDEVHERSVDSDVCCYFARDLLSRHPTLRVILMSATIHSELYRNYFASTPDDDCMCSEYGDMEVLSVGVRRYPLKIFYGLILFFLSYLDLKKNKFFYLSLISFYNLQSVNLGDLFLLY